MLVTASVRVTTGTKDFSGSWTDGAITKWLKQLVWHVEPSAPNAANASIKSEAKYICSRRKRLQAREIWPWGKGVFAGALGRYWIGPSSFGVRNAAVIALRVLTVLQWQSSQWVENLVYGQAVQEVGSKGEETRPSKRSGGMSSKSSQKQARTLCWTLFGLALFPSLPPQASASDTGSVVGIYGDDEAGKTLRELFNKVSRFSLSIWCSRTHVPFDSSSPRSIKTCSDQAASQHKLLGGSHSTLLISNLLEMEIILKSSICELHFLSLSPWVARDWRFTTVSKSSIEDLDMLGVRGAGRPTCDQVVIWWSTNMIFWRGRNTCVFVRLPTEKL